MTTGSNPPDFVQVWQESWQEWLRAWTSLPEATPPGERPPPTPGEAWKRSMDRWLTAWSGFLEDRMSQPAFAAASGQALNRVLDVQKPLRDQTEATMQRWLEAMNMPSRGDLVRLARQINDVNARLDDLSDQLESIEDALAVLADQADTDGKSSRSTGARNGARR